MTKLYTVIECIDLNQQIEAIRNANALMLDWITASNSCDIYLAFEFDQLKGALDELMAKKPDLADQDLKESDWDKVVEFSLKDQEWLTHDEDSDSRPTRINLTGIDKTT